MKIKQCYLLVITLLTSLTISATQTVSGIDIPFSYAKGQVLFEQYCSSCHGTDLNGSDKGPPLLHPYYKPSHHGDEAFYRAALKGVRAHHWNFGDMPAVIGMTTKKMDSIVPYVRYFQQQKKLY